jgi:hypothetical protein
MYKKEYVFNSDIKNSEELIKNEMKRKYDVKTCVIGNSVIFTQNYRYGPSCVSVLGKLVCKENKTFLTTEYRFAFFIYIFELIAVAFIMFTALTGYVHDGDSFSLYFILLTLCMALLFALGVYGMMRYDYKILQKSLKWLDSYECADGNNAGEN